MDLTGEISRWVGRLSDINDRLQFGVCGCLQ